MAYPSINGTLVSNDLAYLLVYANDVTHNIFGWVMTLSFFLVVLLGSFFYQMRFNPANPRFDTSLLASSFATVGWVVILEQYSGILNPIHFFLVIGIFILSLIWVAFSSN